MRYILILCLTACTTVPVSQHMPAMPSELSKPCAPLEIIAAKTVTLSELMKVVAKNYSSRHECASQLDAINEWYIDQKKNFDSANK